MGKEREGEPTYQYNIPHAGVAYQTNYENQQYLLPLAGIGLFFFLKLFALLIHSLCLASLTDVEVHEAQATAHARYPDHQEGPVNTHVFGTVRSQLLDVDIMV